MEIDSDKAKQLLIEISKMHQYHAESYAEAVTKKWNRRTETAARQLDVTSNILHFARDIFAPGVQLSDFNAYLRNQYTDE